MNARAGVVVSQVVWLASLPVTTAAPDVTTSAKGAVAGFVVAALASFLPDLDHPTSTAGRYMPRLFRRLMGGHRMGCHSIFMIAFMWWVTGYLIGNPIIANAVAVGFGTHVFIDMLTLQGVGLLYPVSRRKIQIGWFTTGSDGEDRFVLVVKAIGAVIFVGYGVLFIATAGGFS